ncbi:hypothetical protein ACIQWN_32485 [Streptomyces vinaceus]|uniref:hypothetical protein n=1 Tax=Streptomyces vinaceus TaxID=1960 RepID=UPI00381B278B
MLYSTAPPDPVGTAVLDPLPTAPVSVRRLARHLANRHLVLLPDWIQDCTRCARLREELLRTAEEGRLGAGAAQAGAEHRALHFLSN